MNRKTRHYYVAVNYRSIWEQGETTKFFRDWYDFMKSYQSLVEDAESEIEVIDTRFDYEFYI